MADPKDIKKSVEETVNQILSADAQPTTGAAPAADIKKSEGDFPVAEGSINSGSPQGVSANGGHDKFRSGSPNTEEEKMMGEAKKKVDEAKKALADAEAELEKAASKMKKGDECKDEKKDDKDADKDKDDMKKKLYGKGMKKSLEELKEHLDSDELELVKTWREECDKDADIAKSQAAAAPAPAAPAAPSMAEITEVLKKAIAEGTADLRKAIDEKDTLIKGLNDKIEKMASQPAYDRRSISTLETLEKSGASDPSELKKSHVLDKMLELQAAGKGVTSHHIAEFEATNNISDPTVRGIVFRELKLN